MKNEQNDGGPAFPTVVVHHNGTMIDRGPGMTLRDWFAGQALAGMRSQNTDAHSGLASELAYMDADAMLARRDTKPEPKLSDPTDLKVGDWVSKHGGEPEQVISVDERGYFKTHSSSIIWSRNGDGFTVVPAPEGSEG